MNRIINFIIIIVILNLLSTKFVKPISLYNITNIDKLCRLNTNYKNCIRKNIKPRPTNKPIVNYSIKKMSKNDKLSNKKDQNLLDNTNNFKELLHDNSLIKKELYKIKNNISNLNNNSVKECQVITNKGPIASKKQNTVIPTQSPVIKQTQSPVIKQTQSSVIPTQSPVIKQTQSPVIKQTQSPFIKQTQSPVNNNDSSDIEYNFNIDDSEYIYDTKENDSFTYDKSNNTDDESFTYSMNDTENIEYMINKDNISDISETINESKIINNNSDTIIYESVSTNNDIDLDNCSIKNTPNNPIIKNSNNKNIQKIDQLLSTC